MQNILPFNPTFEDNTLFISFPKNFRGRVWSEYFGNIQRIMHEGKIKGKQYKTICLDMHSCEWADPLPMLSLCLALELMPKEIKKELIIPRIEWGKLIDKQYSAFLAFFAQEGFLDIFEKKGVSIYVFDKKKLLNDKEKEYLRENHNLLMYSNCHVMSARIVEFKIADDENIDAITEKLVYQLLKDQLSNIQSKTPNNYAGNIYFKLYHILFETINNIIRYSETDPLCAGLYIRYRTGLGGGASNSLSDNQKENINNLKEEEVSSNPQLSGEMIDNSEGFFEVFIIDSGIGIQKSFNLSSEIKKKKDFLSCFQDVFFNRVRNPKSTYLTPYGGLDLIQQILGEEHDYIFAHEGFQWIGFNSSKKPVDVSTYHSKFYQSKNYPVNGLSWIFRLSWKSKSVRDIEHIIYFYGGATQHPVYKAIYHYDKEIINEYTHSFYIDNRENSWSGNKFIQKNKPYRNFFWLPSESNSKNEIVYALEKYVRTLYFCIAINKEKTSRLDDGIKEKTLEEWFVNSFNSCRTKKDIYLKIIDPSSEIRLIRRANEIINMNDDESENVLYILDVPSYEMVVYKNSLDGFNFKDRDDAMLRNIFSGIIVCSRQFEVMAFTIKEGTLKIDDSIADLFINKNTEVKTKGLREVFQWLRFHDSIRFWNTLLNESDSSSYYTNADIKWNDESKITGYLHMENIMSHPILFKFIKESAERLLGLFKDKNAVFKGSDILVHQIIDECNIENFESKNLEGNTIVLNSIYATGITLLSMTEHINTENTILCNIFCHPSIKKGKGMLLLWMTQKWINKRLPKVQEKYRRIGGTPFIEKESFENSKGIPYIINRNAGEVYFRSYEDTYKDIQVHGLNMVQIGHYEYESSHNFFKFNYKKIIEDSIRSKSGVFSYLLKTIFFSLVDSENLNFEKLLSELREDWRPAIESEYQQGYLDKNNWNDVSIIIYSNHHYTLQLVRALKQCLPNFADRFVPIDTSVSLHKNGIVIPPSSIELIQKKLKKYVEDKKKHIIILDTYIETGKTRKAFKHILLSSLCNNYWDQSGDIKMLSIIDSVRLPYNAPDKDRHHSYWRFDIPRLGNVKACALCSALSKAQELKTELRKTEINSNYGFSSKKEIINRIDNWIKSWQAISSLQNVNEHGITETLVKSINTSKISKGFSPLINTNIGLAVYNTELNSIQLDENITLKIIKELNSDYEQTILLIASRLFLYGRLSSRSSQIKLLEQLILSLSKIKENNYSSLAALLLLTQNEELIEETIFNIIDKIYYSENIDLLIFLSYFAQRNDLVYHLLPIKIIYPFDNKERREAYQDFHFIIYNELGENHQNSLEKVCGNGLSYSEQNSEILLRRAYYSLQSAWEDLSFIHPTEYDINHIHNLNKIYKDILNLNNDIKNLLTVHNSDLETLVLSQINTINKSLNHYHDKLFISYDHIGDAIKEIVTKNNEAFKIKEIGVPGTIKVCKYGSAPATNLKSYWLIWNNDVKLELQDLLSNVRHSSGHLLKVNMENEYEVEAHMFVEIEIDSDYCYIRIRNYSKNDGSYVRKMLAEKNSRRLYVKRNKQLGIILKCKSQLVNRKHDLLIEVKIPVLKVI